MNIFCDKCESPLEISDASFEAFFHSRDIICTNCKQRIDLWDALKMQFDSLFVSFGWHYSLLGCQGRVIKIVLKPNEIYNLDLSREIGEGKLLYINYTPDGGGLFPTQIHSNTPLTHIIPTKISLFPRPLKENASETQVHVLYWFAPKEIKDDLSVMLLLDAFQRFYEKNYRYMVISAQTAIEILQYKLFERLFELGDLSKDRIKTFLEDKATFSSQLFTLLPLLGKIMNFPIPNSKIFEGLKILVKTRNDVIHRGKPRKQLDEDQMKIALMSAFFTLKYYKIIHKID